MKHDYFDDIGFLPRSAGIRTYATGLGLSLLLTLGAYFVATEHLVGAAWIVPTLIVLALLQFFTQAAFFLHIVDRNSKERLAIFLMATLVICILVGGSLWIMTSLAARMTLPTDLQMEQYMQDQSGF